MTHFQSVDKIGNKAATVPRNLGAAGPPAGAAAAPCQFILSGDEAVARRARYCGAPAAPGSAYCARHRALCAIRPDSVEGGRLVRRLRREAEQVPAPPEEYAYLSDVAVAELDSADEPRDIAACLDIPPDRGTAGE